ncbi:HAD family phosphatase [bacterium]|nr:HAD family phosphatase [candidate division CSSED10-310 bacterium]
MKRGMLIDFDGTLVDSEPIHYQANAKAFREIGHSVDPQEYYYYWSLLGESFQGEIKRHQLENVNVEVLKEKSNRYFNQLCEENIIPLMPGALAFIEEIQRRGIQFIIASNTPTAKIQRILSKTQLRKFTIPAVGNDGKLRNKPFPDIFLAAAERLKLKPVECVAVEDTVKGLNAALNADITCIIIKSHRYDYRTISFKGAHSVFNSLMDYTEAIPIYFS